MKKILAAFCVFSFVSLGAAVAQVVEKRPEWPATETEIYVLDKLSSDGKQLLDAEAQVKAARLLHEKHLKAFVSDAAKGHGINLSPGKTLAWDAESKAFYVTEDGSPVAPPVSADVAPSKSAP